MMANGIARTIIASSDSTMSRAALDPGPEALQRHVVHVDDRQAVEFFEAGAQRNELQDVGDHLDVDVLAAGDLHQLEQLRVLFDRQRDIEVIDALGMDDVGDIRQLAEQRQPAISQVVAAGAVVDEPDDLIAELAVLQHAVGQHPAEIAGAGNQNPLQPDAGAPSPLEQLTDRLARGIGERDGQHEKQPPDDLRDLVGAVRPVVRGGLVGLEVQRGEHAGDDHEDAADEHAEEVVDARAAASQPVDALEVEHDRRQQRDRAAPP